MGIGKIGSVDHIYPVQPTGRVESKELQKQELPVSLQQERESTPAVADDRGRMADLADISLQFNTGDTFDYIGKDSELTLLDVEQAISDMKKDSILDQYRYFVGSRETEDYMSGLAGDGIVFLK